MAAKPVSCKLCGEAFSSESRCKKHAKTCTPFACGQCDEKFKSKTALQEHTKTHRQFIHCPLCNVVPFKNAAQLEEHCFRDHNVPIECKFCDMTFTTPKARDIHVKMKHTDFSDFKCPCGYKFPTAARLQAHQESCVLSKKGATVAIKRRFAELCASTDSACAFGANEMPEVLDRNAACTQAFSDVRAEAQMRLACKCSHCDVCFASKDSLKRHLRKVRASFGPSAQTARSSAEPA